MSWIPWAWVILGLAFLAAEMFTGGFFIACFGVGAIGAGLGAWLGLGMAGQMIVFLLLSGLAVALSRPFANRMSGIQLENVGVDRVLGKQGRVVEAIDPERSVGRVRLDVEEWRAESSEGTPIPVGSMVEILGVEGTRLRVRAIAPPSE